MTGPRDVDLAVTGERLERLLEASSAAGPASRDRAEELVGLLVDLYGAGLARVLEITQDCGRFDGPLRDALGDDPLVGGLLLVHDLHPHPVAERVRRALARLDGAPARLVEVGDDGTVTVQAERSGDRELVEEAVRAVAPAAPAVVVRTPPVFVPLGSLLPAAPGAPA